VTGEGGGEKKMERILVENKIGTYNIHELEILNKD
jgi:hypothetical protein